MNDKPKRRVVCAAIRNCKGQIVCGARHFDGVMRAQLDTSKRRRYWKTYVKVFGRIIWRCPPVAQGFIDQWGVFMDRTEAWKVAMAAGQVMRRCGGDTTDGGTLFSENLY